jgi:hypothetical protein
MIFRWWRRRRLWGYIVTAMDPRIGRRVVAIDARRTCATRAQAAARMDAMRADMIDEDPGALADVRFALTEGPI